MNLEVKSCYLRPVDDTLLTIYLPDSTPVFIGRSPESNITDTKCSRQQVRVYANYGEHKVYVQQVGTRACGFNGFKTEKDVKFVGKHNDHLEILYGKYSYQIEFNPPPKESPKQSISRKRSYQSDVETEEGSESSKMQKKADEESVEDRKGNSENAAAFKKNNHENTDKGGSWESINNGKILIFSPGNLQHKTKIAAYDMDGTLIKTRSGLVFPKDCHDWELLLPDVPGKLKQFHADGYKVVIFTNQRGLGKGKIKISDFKLKIERIIQKIGVPIQVFIAAGESPHRKPTVTMWNTLLNDKNGGLVVDVSNSFYIGDAAGRAKNWIPGKKKDHSLADRLFALNIGIKFQTPEEHFLGYKEAAYSLPKFDPRNLPGNGNICNPHTAEIVKEEQEMILMVGSPGSGKSHFVKCYLTKYERVNRDILGSWQKCVSLMDDFLTQGKSVVVDNTNPDPSSRQRYIEIAKKRRVPVRCFVMSTSSEHAKHNNKFRELTDPTHVKITDVIIDSYMKNYLPPSVDEGFKEIVQVNFVPKFLTGEHEQLYKMYLLET